LQTLRIEKCGEFIELPEELSNLINLRHFYHDYFKHYGDNIIETPKNMGWLCLQTLSYFVVGGDEGGCIKELGPLKKLRGDVN